MKETEIQIQDVLSLDLYHQVFVSNTVLSVNEYTPFKKYHFKQHLNEHKNNFQNVEYMQV